MIVNPILQPRPRGYALFMNLSEVHNHIITPHILTTALEFLGDAGARISGTGGIQR